MLPDRVSNPGPLTYESGALPIALRGPASCKVSAILVTYTDCCFFTLNTHIVKCNAQGVLSVSDRNSVYLRDVFIHLCKF